jgi:hypothetical protein
VDNYAVIERRGVGQEGVAVEPARYGLSRLVKCERSQFVKYAGRSRNDRKFSPQFGIQ